MRRNLVLLLTLCALPALATPERYLYETQSLTRTAPSTASDGMSLLADSGRPVRGFMVSVCAASGQTLSGTGHLRAWVYHPDAALWMRNRLLDLEVTESSARCQAFPDFRTGYFQGRRVLFAADAVTVAGTATDPTEQDKLKVRIDGDTTL